MTITFASWWIPTIITIVSILWALLHDDGTSGYFSGLGNILLLIPALGISLISWIIYVICT